MADSTRALPLHHLCRRFAYLVNRRQIHSHNPVPFLAGKLIRSHTMRKRIDAGVIHHNVQPSAPRHDGVHHATNVPGIRDIQLQRVTASFRCGGFRVRFIDVRVKNRRAVC
jgi:hypothetical protein